MQWRAELDATTFLSSLTEEILDPLEYSNATYVEERLREARARHRFAGATWCR